MKTVSQELCACSLWGKLRTQGRPCWIPGCWWRDLYSFREGVESLHLDGRAGEWWGGESTVQMRRWTGVLASVVVEDIEKILCQTSETNFRSLSVKNFVKLSAPPPKKTYSKDNMLFSKSLLSCFWNYFLDSSCDTHNQTSPSDGMHTSRLRSCLHQSPLDSSDVKLVSLLSVPLTLYTCILVHHRIIGS